MRSAVGWLCFGIVFVFVISVKSGVPLGNYHHVIHEHGYAYPGPILQNLVPAIGYRSIVPQVVVRREEARYDNVDKEALERHQYKYDSEEEEEEDDHEHGGNSHSSPYPDEHSSDEEQHQEEEEETNEHEGGGESSEEESNQEEEYQEHYEEGYYGRKTYRNNKVHSVQTIPGKPANKIKAPLLQKNSSIADQLNQRKKSNKSKKKKPYAIHEEIQAVKTNLQISNVTNENNESPKQKYQLKSNINHFVATPIADLILRLSISLARPIGHGNGTATYLNVPIRLSNNGTEEKNINTALNASTSKVKTELPKTHSIIVKKRGDSIKVVTVPIKADALDIDDDEEDGEDIDQLSA